MNKKGFTLIELMVVVLIVAVLAAILFPYMAGRLEAARWAEGKAGCGTLATAVRAMWAEMGEESFPATLTPAECLTKEDLRGKYFSIGDYTIVIDLEPDGDYPVGYEISVDQPSDSTVTGLNWTKAGYKLDHMGLWEELSGTPAPGS
ncbi:MAG: prepilin-type N-terminal cleavage/methylation domain-containing protein [Planctomycetota bacterium]|jgi:prepilin-type N-terminal cleavage/methylation domain-containing protein